jgi:hypothetical protein
MRKLTASGPPKPAVDDGVMLQVISDSQDSIQRAIARLDDVCRQEFLDKVLSSPYKDTIKALPQVEVR